MVLLPRLRVVCWLAWLALASCGRDRAETERPRAELAEPPSPSPVPLDPAFFGEALRALRPYAAAGESVLEVRASGTRVAVQVRVAQTPTVAEYAYDGRVVGPLPTHVAGEGELETNLFDLRGVDFEALARLFPTARDAVDPLDGVVTEVVVRRHLPFSRDLRARIYVASPRLKGHLDSDAQGAPLQGAALTAAAPPH
jgi:hypothetical protein